MHASRLQLLAGSILLGLVLPAAAVDFTQMNLVTDDQSEYAAQITDPALKNAWGVSFGPTTPFWVSAQGTNVSTVYLVDPLTQATTKAPLTVSVSGGPTGQVFNGSSGFNADRFLFVGVDGSVSGWRNTLGTTAEVLVAPSSANAYTGAAFGSLSGSSYLYGANFKAGTIDVYKGDAAAPTLTGSFTDASLPSGYSPFNVQNLGDTLYVAYAKPGEGGEEEAGPGLGIVDAYSLNGDFLGRIATGGTLNAPWGLAIAPESFGDWAGSLLVGNFGDGRISAFDASTHSFLGQVTGSNGEALEIEGLWAITPGNDTSAGSSKLLYFSAGPDDEEHGLFGVLVAVPEPSTYAMMLLGLGVVGMLGARQRRRG
jgi:uncharacterized protein (TIGR03118 family)